METIHPNQVKPISHKLRLGFLASYNGTDMQAIHRATQNGQLDAEVVIVISNNSQANALKYAKEQDIPRRHISRVTEGSAEGVDQQIRDELVAAGVNLVILSGYMQHIGQATLNEYEGRILNVHPALPDSLYRGQGYYGDRIHQAVLDNKDEETGVTIHIVDEIYDHGPLVASATVAVDSIDTVESLRRRVQAAEKQLFIKTLQAISQRETQEG